MKRNILCRLCMCLQVSNGGSPPRVAFSGLGTDRVAVRTLSRAPPVAAHSRLLAWLGPMDEARTPPAMEEGEADGSKKRQRQLAPEKQRMGEREAAWQEVRHVCQDFPSAYDFMVAVDDMPALLERLAMLADEEPPSEADVRVVVQHLDPSCSGFIPHSGIARLWCDSSAAPPAARRLDEIESPRQLYDQSVLAMEQELMQRQIDLERRELQLELQEAVRSSLEKARRQLRSPPGSPARLDDRPWRADTSPRLSAACPPAGVPPYPSPSTRTSAVRAAELGSPPALTVQRPLATGLRAQTMPEYEPEREPEPEHEPEREPEPEPELEPALSIKPRLPEPSPQQSMLAAVAYLAGIDAPDGMSWAADGTLTPTALTFRSFEARETSARQNLSQISVQRQLDMPGVDAVLGAPASAGGELHRDESAESAAPLQRKDQRARQKERAPARRSKQAKKPAGLKAASLKPLLDRIASLEAEKDQMTERVKQLESRCSEREQECEAMVAECDALRHRFKVYREEEAVACAADPLVSTTAEADAALEAVQIKLSKSEARVPVPQPSISIENCRITSYS